MTKAVAESYDTFKDASPIMPRWNVAKAGTPPMDAAFHDGAIGYLQEAGIWKPEHQAWQDGTLKRHATLQAAWRSEEHTSEFQSLMRISYAVFCLKTKKNHYGHKNQTNQVNSQTRV